MAALAASDVTYLALGRSAAPNVTEDSTRTKMLGLIFGDGVKTYPLNGVPLSNLKKNGFPNVVESLVFSSMFIDGFLYKYDPANNTIRIFQEADTAGQLAELTIADAVVATVLTVVVSGH